MSLIKLTVEKRRGVDYSSSPLNVLVDTADIDRPIVPEKGGSLVYIDESIKTNKKEKNVNSVEYIVSESPADIAALSDDLFLADVRFIGANKRLVKEGNETQCFPIHKVVGPIIEEKETSKFLVYEGESPVPVEYSVFQNVEQIQSTL